MAFEHEKKLLLARKDKSKKGGIDGQIKNLLGKINALPDYYTTSSCAGRVMLYGKPGERKNQPTWIFVSHEPVEFADLMKSIERIPDYPVWLKAEPMIVHVCARTIEHAKEFLEVCNNAGLKRAGIIGIGKRIIVEAAGTEVIDAIIADRGKMLVENGYMERLVAEANDKLKKNFLRIKRLENAVMELKKLMQINM